MDNGLSKSPARHEKVLGAKTTELLYILPFSRHNHISKTGENLTKKSQKIPP
jgi:hypothetical protein